MSPAKTASSKFTATYAQHSLSYHNWNWNSLSNQNNSRHHITSSPNKSFHHTLYQLPTPSYSIHTMTKLVFALVAILLPSASAFSHATIITSSERRSSSTSTKLSYVPQQETPEPYVRAVDCANNYGLCSVDELLDLSEGEGTYCYWADTRV